MAETGTPVSATSVADQLLSSTSAALATFERERADFEVEQSEKRQALQQLVERDRAAVTRATERLGELYREARSVADNKGRRDVLEGILRQNAAVDTSRDFDSVDTELRHELKLARGITGTMRVPDVGRLLNQAAVQVDHLEDRANALEERLREASSMDTEGSPARRSFDQALATIRRDLAELDQMLPLSARPWEAPDWTSATAPVEPRRFIRFGRFTDERLGELAVPALLEFPGDAGVVVEPARRRDEAIDGVRSLVLRAMTAFPLGGATFTFVDPKGLGENVAQFSSLAASHPDLIEGVFTREDEIERQLAALSGSAVDRQRDGRSLSPPGRYRFLVMFDHPAGLSSRSISLVRSLTESGPAVGVFSIVVKDPKPGKYPREARTLPSLRTIKATKDGFETETAAGKWTLALDAVPGPEAYLRLADMFESTDHPAVPEASVDLVDDHTWWADRSTDHLTLLPSPNQELALRFDRSTSGVVVIGRHRSGLTTFLQDVTTRLAAHYSPTELQLFLIGLGGSLDFEPYVHRRLAHARLIGLDASRELAISTLETAVGEIARRLVLFQATGVQRDGLAAYRNETDKALPRVVVGIDHASELFAHRDTLGRRSTELLTQIMLDGGLAGVHLLLTDHVEHNAADLLDKLPDNLTCVLLACTDTDAHAVLGDDLADTALPRDPGEYVIASHTGSVASGRMERTDQAERAATLRMLRTRAETDNVSHEPRVVDGRIAARLERAPFDLLRERHRQPEDRLVPRIWLGEPLVLGSPVQAPLSREEGTNLLVVVSDPMIGQGLSVSAMTSAAIDSGGSIELQVVDFMGLETGFGENVRSLDGMASVSLERRRNSRAAIERVRNLVVNRLARDERGAPTCLFVLNGLEHAGDLEVGAPRGDGADALVHLEQIVRDGPPVGIHTIVWVQHRATLESRLSRDVARRFALRVVGPMDAASSTALIDSPRAAELRTNQTLLYDEPRARLERFRPYGLAESGRTNVTGARLDLTSSAPTTTDLR